MAKIQCNMISYKLQRTVDIDIILPTVTIPQTRHQDVQPVHHTYPHPYPVLYLLHGYGNNHKQWCGYTNVELFAEERQIAVVMIAGENKFYMNYSQDLFYDFIEEELPEFITQTFPISSRPQDTYIAGLSMGGFGALYHGLTHPEHYHAIGAFSPALTKDDVSIENITKEVLSKQEKLPDIYIACGDQDFLYEADLAYVQLLKDQNVSHTWVSEPGYEHEWRFWNLCIERFLDWLDREDFYAHEKRKV